MSEVKWTSDQLNAITARDGTLLVSAAAGSGKTAVLVQRVIKHLTDPEKPVDANRLLIVTFTRAATSEMRSRLAAELNRAIAENPEDRNLERQKRLLPFATISTIDAFSSGLVRENFSRLGVSPDFRMLDESEKTLLQNQALDTVMDRLYKENDPAFRSLVEMLFRGFDDTYVKDAILRLYTFSRAYPDPNRWLDNSLKEYSDYGETVTESEKIIVKHLRTLISSGIGRMEQELKTLESMPELSGSRATEIIGSETEDYRKLLSYLDDFDLDSLKEWAENRKFDRWSSPKGTNRMPEVIKAKTVRNEVKDETLKEIKKTLAVNSEDTAADKIYLVPVVEKLIEAVKLFSDEYMNLKTEKNALDFSDTQLLALKLLLDDPGSETAEKTDYAKEISGRYDEILIDEYQDTNRAQDLMFRAVSRNGENMFMVGDVKQSIYSFRQAMPEIFLERRRAYPIYDPEKNIYPATVILGKNFRSRKGVTDIINDIFETVMSREAGDIDYDDTEKLFFGADYYEPVNEPETEFHIVRQDKDSRLSKNEQQAAEIGKFILSEMEKEKKKGNSLHFRDFTILVRSTKTVGDEFKKVLNEYGIPVYTESGGSFLETADIQLILSFLRVIDNPLNDVPLLSLLMSPFFMFTPDDMAEIRSGKKNGSLYSAVLAASEKGNGKCIKFLSVLEKYRRLAVSLPAGDLVRKIYEDTAYDSIVSAMPAGEKRKADLDLLKEFADSYDSNSTYGLSGFIRYIDRVAEKNFDNPGGATLSAESDVVRIMTIHKSKGLQFKYCIVANLEKQFNVQEQRSSLIIHPVLGIGMKGRDSETGNSYPTLFHTAARLALSNDDLSENIRVLYVALTRAEEKLVLFATDSNPESTVEKMAARLTDKKAMEPFLVSRARCFYDWILAGLIRHPGALELRNLTDIHIAVLPSEGDLKFVLHENTEDEPEDETVNEEPEASADGELVSEISERLNYRYPFSALSSVQAKRSASSGTDSPFDSTFFARTKPAFLQGGSMTPAEKGTALHQFMQFADFSKAEENPEKEADRLLNDKFISEAQRAVIDTEKIRTFFRSPVAERMKKADLLLREHRFTRLVPASVFNPGLPENMKDEKVLIQGIIDCAFFEGDSIVLLDYKTDRVKSPDELKERYRGQMKIYSDALEDIFGKPVKEKLLYSFHLGKTVEA